MSRFNEVAHWCYVVSSSELHTYCGYSFDYASAGTLYAVPTNMITCLRCTNPIKLHPKDKMFMVVTKTDEDCTCACHAGDHKYHVRWKPCCDAPVDGGKKARVFEIETKDGMRPVIATTQTEAEGVLRELNLL